MDMIVMRRHKMIAMLIAKWRRKTAWDKMEKEKLLMEEAENLMIVVDKH